jgi:hypothetical protein
MFTKLMLPALAAFLTVLSLSARERYLENVGDCGPRIERLHVAHRLGAITGILCS